MRKRGQFNFVWLFALIVGAAILFFAIFGALRAGETQNFQADSELAKELTILTDPLQAGFSEGSFGVISFRSETRINNFCFEDLGFGKNALSVSTRSNIGEEWSVPGVATEVVNKYIFSSSRSSRREYFVFSRVWGLPYEVADLLMITPEHYCFINAPQDIEDELVSTQVPNIEFGTCLNTDAIRVCFGSGGSNCDMIVTGCGPGCDEEYDAGKVIKAGEDLFYSGNLLYAAIFSEKDIYDCNVNRLLYRTEKLAEELELKANYLDARGCGTNMQPRLNLWQESLRDATAQNLRDLHIASKNLERDNRREVCGVWS